VNSKNLTKAERAHLARVKALACSCCDAPGPSAAHHIHQGPGGWHDTKSLWRVRKLDELGALNITLSRLL